MLHLLLYLNLVKLIAVLCDPYPEFHLHRHRILNFGDYCCQVHAQHLRKTCYHQAKTSWFYSQWIVLLGQYHFHQPSYFLLNQFRPYRHIWRLLNAKRNHVQLVYPFLNCLFKGVVREGHAEILEGGLHCIVSGSRNRLWSSRHVNGQHSSNGK